MKKGFLNNKDGMGGQRTRHDGADVRERMKKKLAERNPTKQFADGPIEGLPLTSSEASTLYMHTVHLVIGNSLGLTKTCQKTKKNHNVPMIFTSHLGLRVVAKRRI